MGALLMPCTAALMLALQAAVFAPLQPVLASAAHDNKDAANPYMGTSEATSRSSEVHEGWHAMMHVHESFSWGERTLLQGRLRPRIRYVRSGSSYKY